MFCFREKKKKDSDLNVFFLQRFLEQQLAIHIGLLWLVYVSLVTESVHHMQKTP